MSIAIKERAVLSCPDLKEKTPRCRPQPSNEDPAESCPQHRGHERACSAVLRWGEVTVFVSG
jgi:hypothetical protein